MSALKDSSQIRLALAMWAVMTVAANASPLYLAVVSEQIFSDPAWLSVADTFAARHGGETVPYIGTVFPETMRATLAARHPAYVCFGIQPVVVYLHKYNGLK